MNIEHIREFVVLAGTGHYQEAAHRLYISQSTLSKHIKSIEAELRVPLFTRTTRRVDLSAQGRVFLPFAQQMLALQDECTHALLASLEDENKRLDIGSIPALAQYGITDTLANFRQEHPGFAINVVQGSSDELKDMLRTGKVEIAFLREAGTGGHKDEFARIPFATDAMVALLPAGHPLATSGAIQLEELREEEFILLDQQSMVYGMSVAACEASGFTPRIAYTDHHVENIRGLVGRGMGVALLMNTLAAYNPDPKVAVVDVLPAVRSTINVCYCKKRAGTIAGTHFLQCLGRY